MIKKINNKSIVSNNINDVNVGVLRNNEKFRSLLLSTIDNLRFNFEKSLESINVIEKELKNAFEGTVLIDSIPENKIQQDVIKKDSVAESTDDLIEYYLNKTKN